MMEFNCNAYKIEENGDYIIVYSKMVNNLELCRWRNPYDKFEKVKLIHELFKLCSKLY